MGYQIPRSAPLLMRSVFRKIFPQVSKELRYWEKKAEDIPNAELREQALASIDSKKFHCQGGSVYSILAGENWTEAVRFIVAYQTISDYLDNLCDRSTSLDPTDFRMLHQAMEDALSPENTVKNYYCHREDQSDGGYLVDLVKTCQDTLSGLSQYSIIKDYLLQLEELYSDLQVHKHVKKEERIPRLEKWFQTFKKEWPSLSWYEFSASSGSTLGIFCMVSYALGDGINESLAKKIFNSYFPFMQGLHILLDYYIDQQEDRIEGDLNFCNYYEDENHLKERLVFFIEQTNKSVQLLPNHRFHEMVHNGLVGLYLADPKVKQLKNGKEITKLLLQASGIRSAFFHLNIKIYNHLKNKPQEA
ncbi:tetraprenyl-beta-curcumene synthase [Paraliobacillus quinghaiensis]|uniref:Tetraprenyl-beta-curcumene synthase n=1 Tax=Paraliobacillus quinghaiensis TaxID=470815 RepID=A0A917TV66_9BACI|nr:tetraprenyl-beta-curcumene synthase family protein [Paraliobacillus quinghaiensis]GGM36918.1 tetraprenyl-beta-curcumene synthase [Paraliobacillus quinghaiensis]